MGDGSVSGLLILVATRRFGATNYLTPITYTPTTKQPLILFRFYRHVKPFLAIPIHTEHSDMEIFYVKTCDFTAVGMYLGVRDGIGGGQSELRAYAAYGVCLVADPALTLGARIRRTQRVGDICAVPPNRCGLDGRRALGNRYISAGGRQFRYWRLKYCLNWTELFRRLKQTGNIHRAQGTFP